MTLFKRLINICLFCIFAMTAMAQSGSNSPYTRYGFGQLSDQSFGNSKAMGGIAYGLRNGLHINAANPASYSAVDSLTFLFDAGMSLQNTNFNENGVKTNAKNSTVDYIAMQFRLWKRMGMTLGFLPYSIVGYNMSKTQTVSNSEDQYGDTTTQLMSYSGDGGLQQVFVGLGYKLFNNFSIGANFSYLYGEISHVSRLTFSNANAYSSVLADKLEINDYKVDLGLQYTQKLGKKHTVNLGAVYSLGHDLNGTGYNFKEILTDKKVYFATIYRLFIAPALVILLLWLAKAPVYMMGLALFAYATPLGMNTVVFPAAFGGETKTGASMALISHTLCVITIPVMYALFTLIFM